MVQFNINNSFIVVEKKSSLITNLKYLGQFLPRFCFHDNLPVAGNCRACLIELSGSEKPIAACVTEVEQNFNLWTNNLFAMKARESVFSFLLINHPLDCPICDQAGECDLQDQTKNFANNSSRFFFKKRGVVDNSVIFGVKTIMTRCIHCTRCVRFTGLKQESKLGILNRGYSSQIGQYWKRLKANFLASNVIDFCPVSSDPAYGTSTKARTIQYILNWFGFAFFFVFVIIFLYAIYAYLICDQFLCYDNLTEVWKKAQESLENAISLSKQSKGQNVMLTLPTEAEIIHEILIKGQTWNRPLIISSECPQALKETALAAYTQAWLDWISADLSRSQGLVINTAQPFYDLFTGKLVGIVLPPLSIMKINQFPWLILFGFPLIISALFFIFSFLLTPNRRFFFFLKKDFLFSVNEQNFIYFILGVSVIYCLYFVFFFGVYFYKVGTIATSKDVEVMLAKKSIFNVLLFKFLALNVELFAFLHKIFWR